MDDIKRQQFDSCSYDELNNCIIYRLDCIREYKRFRAVEMATKYPKIYNNLSFQILGLKQEIHRIWKIRHFMKRYNIKNWNHEYEISMNLVKEKP